MNHNPLGRNPACKGLEFETFRNQAGLNRFSFMPRKWIEATGAIGFQSKAGRYGGTYAHISHLSSIPKILDRVESFDRK